VVTLRGENFGLQEGGAVFLVDDEGVRIAATVLFWNHTLIRFSVPPWQGDGVRLSLEAGGQPSSSLGNRTLSWKYDPPQVFSMSPKSAETTGRSVSGSNVTIAVVGMNFGVRRSVRLGATVMVELPGGNHTHMWFNATAGQGTRDLRITVGSQTHAQNENVTRFRHNPPVIQFMNPLAGRTDACQDFEPLRKFYDRRSQPDAVKARLCCRMDEFTIEGECDVHVAVTCWSLRAQTWSADDCDIRESCARLHLLVGGSRPCLF
jgi:hypothetical protein